MCKQGDAMYRITSWIRYDWIWWLTGSETWGREKLDATVMRFSSSMIAVEELDWRNPGRASSQRSLWQFDVIRLWPLSSHEDSFHTQIYLWANLQVADFLLKNRPPVRTQMSNMKDEAADYSACPGIFLFAYHPTDYNRSEKMRKERTRIRGKFSLFVLQERRYTFWREEHWSDPGGVFGLSRKKRSTPRPWTEPAVLFFVTNEEPVEADHSYCKEHAWLLWKIALCSRKDAPARTWVQGSIVEKLVEVYDNMGDETSCEESLMFLFE